MPQSQVEEPFSKRSGEIIGGFLSVLLFALFLYLKTENPKWNTNYKEFQPK